MTDVTVKLDASRVLKDCEAEGARWDRRHRRHARLLWAQGALTAIWLASLAFHWLVIR